MTTPSHFAPFTLFVESRYDNNNLGLSGMCVSEVSIKCPELLGLQAILHYFTENKLRGTFFIIHSYKDKLTFGIRDDTWALVESSVCALKGHLEKAITQYRRGILEPPPKAYTVEL